MRPTGSERAPNGRQMSVHVRPEFKGREMLQRYGSKPKVSAPLLIRLRLVEQSESLSFKAVKTQR